MLVRIERVHISGHYAKVSCEATRVVAGEVQTFQLPIFTVAKQLLADDTAFIQALRIEIQRAEMLDSPARYVGMEFTV